MRKLIIILLFVPVFGFSQSSLVINGPMKEYFSRCTSINPYLARDGIGSFEIDTVNVGLLEAGWEGTFPLAPVYMIWRSGAIFDCSSIPYKSTIDSITLTFNAENFVTSGWYNFYACPDIDPENETKSLTLAFRDLVKSKVGLYVAMQTAWLKDGANTVTFYDAPFSNIYPRAISIGFGILTGDAVPPYIPTVAGCEISSMVMTIYYHGGGTPSPQKIKIIGVI